MFDRKAPGSAGAPSLVEHRLRALLTQREGGIEVHPAPAPFVVVVDLEARRCPASGSPAGAAHGEPLDPRARLLETGAGHLDALADLELVMARAAAAQARGLAAFARCRPRPGTGSPGRRAPRRRPAGRLAPRR